MEILNMLIDQLGVTEEQARGGAGIFWGRPAKAAAWRGWLAALLQRSAAVPENWAASPALPVDLRAWAWIPEWWENLSRLSFPLSSQKAATLLKIFWRGS